MNTDSLETLAKEALSQLDDMRYDSEMKESRIQNILKLGIAFSGKKVCVKVKEKR